MKPQTYTITSIYADPAANLTSKWVGIKRASARVAECLAIIERDRTRDLGTGRNAESPMIGYTVSPAIDPKVTA